MDPHLVRIAVLAFLAASACVLVALPRPAHGQAAVGEINGATDGHDVPPYAERRTDIVRAEER